jgi:hypothetical protein
MTRDEKIRSLAEVLAGLQVPLSISGELGHKILGAADEPFRTLLRDVGFGWHDADDFEEYLRDGLIAEEVSR